MLQSIELARNTERPQLLIVIAQALFRYWQLSSPRILDELQRPLKDQLPLFPFVFPNRYIGKLCPAVSALRSMPDLETAISVDLWKGLSTLDAVPVIFSSVAKAHMPVPTAAVHLVYPDITLNGESVLLGEHEKDGGILLHVLWVNKTRTSAWVGAQFLGEVSRTHDREEAWHSRLLGVLVIAFERVR